MNIHKSLRKALVAVSAVVTVALAPQAFAAVGAAALDAVPAAKLGSKEAMQNGAKIFLNTCIGCHGMSAMRYSRLTDIGFTEEQIIGFLREAEAGMPVAELCRKHAFSEASYYLWRSKFGGMSVSDAKRLKELEAENTRLKKLLAESLLENEIAKEALRKKWWANHHAVIW